MRFPNGTPVDVKLWARLERKPSGCWEFQGSRNQDGYGLLRDHGRTLGAHRLAWALHNQADPGDLLVCHRCDNPPCCNPHHLYAGTYSDNQNDRTNWRYGDRANRTRMTDAQVIEARGLYVRRSRPGAGTSALELAEHYGVTVPYFVRLVRGSTPRQVAA